MEASYAVRLEGYEFPVFCMELGSRKWRLTNEVLGWFTSFIYYLVPEIEVNCC